MHTAHGGTDLGARASKASAEVAHLHKPSSKTSVLDLGKGAWKPAYFEVPYLLLMSANDFITGRSLALPTCQFCF